jgi:hypothetical protein
MQCPEKPRGFGAELGPVFSFLHRQLTALRECGRCGCCAACEPANLESFACLSKYLLENEAWLYRVKDAGAADWISDVWYPLGFAMAAHNLYSKEPWWRQAIGQRRGSGIELAFPPITVLYMDELIRISHDFRLLEPDTVLERKDALLYRGLRDNLEVQAPSFGRDGQIALQIFRDSATRKPALSRQMEAHSASAGSQLVLLWKNSPSSE